MKKVLLIMLLCITTLGYAQAPKKVTVGGTVTEYGTKLPVVQAVVVIPELNVWAVTDAKGQFKLPPVSVGTYTMDFTCLGYEKVSQKVNFVKDNLGLAIEMKTDNLTLDQVVVTAETGKGTNTSSTINRAAMNHLQMSSASDALQLLPGAITTNPNLTGYNRMGIRELSNNGPMANFGTAVIVDGGVLSNDANLNAMSEGSSGQRSPYGADVRKLSADDIESIEVVRGVASAAIGDLTSGAVIIKTKAGRSPFEVRVKADPKMKSFSVSKGFGVGELGALNVNAAYAHAFTDIVSPYTSFNRYNMGLGYSTTFMDETTPLTFNAKVSAAFARDGQKNDPDNMRGTYSKNRDDDFRASINGSWMLNKSWLTSLTYSASASYGDKYGKERVNRSTSISGVLAEESGESYGVWYPSQYYQVEMNDNKPVYVDAKLGGNISGKYGNILNKLIFGVDWSTRGNIGNGITYEKYRESGSRPYSYNDIPFYNNLALYAEDGVTLPLGSTTLELTAGVRASTVYEKEDRYTNGWVVDPRFNARYTILKNEKTGNFLAVRAGWGKQSKLPYLTSFYSEPSYYDVRTYTKKVGNENVDIFATHVKRDKYNKNLKIATSRNFEAAAEFQFAGIRGEIVYYNEKLKNPYVSFVSANEAVEIFEFNRYNTSTKVNATAKRPVLYPDGLFLTDMTDPANPTKGASLLSHRDSMFVNVSKPGNAGMQTKQGVEFTLDFGQIKSIRTSFVLDGSYIHIKSEDETLRYISRNQTGTLEIGGKDQTRYNRYMAVYPGGMGSNNVSNGMIEDRATTNLRIITHLPAQRLVITLGLQAVWYESSRNLSKYKGEDYAFAMDADQNPLPGGSLQGAPNKFGYGIYPVAYVDLQGNMYPFTAECLSNPELSWMRYSTTFSNRFQRSYFNPYFMANIHVTKEIGKFASLSFYANNFTNSQKLMSDHISGFKRSINSRIYFGAELKLTF